MMSTKEIRITPTNTSIRMPAMRGMLRAAHLRVLEAKYALQSYYGSRADITHNIPKGKGLRAFQRHYNLTCENELYQLRLDYQNALRDYKTMSETRHVLRTSIRMLRQSPTNILSRGEMIHEQTNRSAR